MGADTRSTAGSTVADKNCEKIHYIAPNIYCCGAGTAADTENVTGPVLFAELHCLDRCQCAMLYLLRLNICRDDSFTLGAASLWHREGIPSRDSTDTAEVTFVQVSGSCQRCSGAWWRRPEWTSLVHCKNPSPAHRHVLLLFSKGMSFMPYQMLMKWLPLHRCIHMAQQIVCHTARWVLGPSMPWLFLRLVTRRT